MAYLLKDYLELEPWAARAQWNDIIRRQPAPPGQRQVPFTPVETLLCLAATFLVDHSRFGSGSAGRAPEPVQLLGKLFKRPPTSILAKMANLDGSRSHGAKYDRPAGGVLRSDTERMAETYRVIFAAARSVGVSSSALPDFLRIEAGGAITLLGQDELTGDAVQSQLERELKEWNEKSPETAEKDTERLLLASVRVGQHRFAKEVLHNCGHECVFCGFALADGESPTLLRASHLKPWSTSSNRERLDFRNGVAACPTHDAAFDVGLLSLDPDLSVRTSRRLKTAVQQNPAVRQVFGPGALRTRIEMPEGGVRPTVDFVYWHREHIFVDG